MRSSNPPRASAIALSLGMRSSTLISVFCRKTWPRSLTEIASGSLSWSRLLAWVCGRSIGTPTVSNGADTMKMISSTSITSTIGVTLISLITGWRWCFRLPTGTPFIAMRRSPSLARTTPSGAGPLGPLVDLARQDRSKLVGEAFKPLGLLVHLRRELVIENRRRYGRHEANRGRKQGFRDPRRDHRERGVLRGRDRLKTRHDAPHRAEQADEGAGRADRRQHQQPAFQPLDLARDRHVHDLLDAHLQAREGARLRFEAALPLAHGRHEQRRHGMGRPPRQRAVEVFERL